MPNTDFNETIEHMREVMGYFRACFGNMPEDWMDVFTIVFYIFVTCSVIKIASWKEHS